MNFSKRTDWVTTANPLGAQISYFKENKLPYLDLTVSNPTLCQFDYLDSELLRPFLNQQNLIYEPDPHGLPNAREAVVQYYLKKGIQVGLDQIFLTSNTTEAYSFIFKLLFDPGDSLLAPQPSYPLLDYLADLHDIRVKRYPLIYEKNWRINFRELERLESPDKSHLEAKPRDPATAGFLAPLEMTPALLSAPNSTDRAVLLVNPNNPTGNFVKEKEKNQILKFCQARSLAVISDEVFLDFPLNTRNLPQSFTGESEVLTFTLSGISKILGLPQMKLSWLIVSGPEKIRREAIRRLEIISDTYLSAGTPPQNALPVWLSKQRQITREISARIEANYDFLLSCCKSARILRGQAEESCLSSKDTLRENFDSSKSGILSTEGGWNAVLRLPDDKTDEEWSLDLLKEERVLTHPGYLFDFPEDHFIILSLLTPPEMLKEGVERILRRVRKNQDILNG